MDEPLLWLGLLALRGAPPAPGCCRCARRARLAGLSAGAAARRRSWSLADNWDAERLADLRDRPLLIARPRLVAAAVGLIAARAALPPPPGSCWRRARSRRCRSGSRSSSAAAASCEPAAAALRADRRRRWSRRWLSVCARRRSARAGRRRARMAALDRPGARAASSPSTRSQAGYADDLSPAVENVAFFLVPFAALFALLAEVRWDRAALRADRPGAGGRGRSCSPLVAGRPVRDRRAVLERQGDRRQRGPRLLPGQLAVLGPEHPRPLPGGDDGRPGRGRRLRPRPPRAARRERRSSSSCSAALVVTFSQSSTIALIAGVLVLIAAALGHRDRDRRRRDATVARRCVASLTLIAGGGLTERGGGPQRPDRRRHRDRRRRARSSAPAPAASPRSSRSASAAAEGFALESHTEPITVARRAGRGRASPPTRSCSRSRSAACSRRPGCALRGRARGHRRSPRALLAVYAVMVVHSLGYAAFLTDPITWAVLAIAAGRSAPAALPGRRALPPGSRPRRRAGRSRARLPAPARHDGRRLHRGERRSRSSSRSRCCRSTRAT